MKVLWSQLAIERVTEIAQYIARDSVSASSRWVNDIFECAAQLEKFPESGRHVPEVIRMDIRELLYGNYRIIYKVEPARAAILTVRHKRQILPVDELDAP